MLAAFGMPGTFELLIVGLICLLVVGVPVVVIASVLWINLKKRSDKES